MFHSASVYSLSTYGARLLRSGHLPGGIQSSVQKNRMSSLASSSSALNFPTTTLFGKEFQSSTTLWDKLNFLEFSLLALLMMFIPWPRVSLEIIVKKSLASRSSMPVMIRSVWFISMRILLYKNAGKVHGSQMVLIAPFHKVWNKACGSSMWTFRCALQMQSA